MLTGTFPHGVLHDPALLGNPVIGPGQEHGACFPSITDIVSVLSQQGEQLLGTLTHVLGEGFLQYGGFPVINGVGNRHSPGYQAVDPPVKGGSQDR